jgi:hypothetical protein
MSSESLRDLGPGLVTQFRIGAEQDGFLYSLAPEDPRLYQCSRNLGGSDSASHFVLYIYGYGPCWYAIEGPYITADGSLPTGDALMERGTYRYVCYHTAVRDGVHRWYVYNPASRRVLVGQYRYFRTTVLSHTCALGPFVRDLQAHELVDHADPISDTDDDGKGSGGGNSSYASGGKGSGD